MSYQNHQIANFATGLETDKAPWMLPDDAQEEIFDAYIEHGIINKRDGYKFYAYGLQGGAPYCESRIVKEVTGVSMTGAIDSANQTYTTTVTAPNLPIRRGTFVVTGTNPAQTATDDGDGGFTGDVSAGSINYLTGAVSVTFNSAPTAGTVTASYDYFPGKPVMMVALFVTGTNTFEMIVADTANLNRYNSTTNRLDDITVRTYTGTKSNFFDWVMYPTVLDTARLIFTNNVDPIQAYNGTTTSDFYPIFTSVSVSTESLDSGDGSAGPYGGTTVNPRVVPGSVTVTANPGGTQQVVTDDSAGSLSGDGTGTIDYATGVVAVTFNGVVPSAANNIKIDYEYGSGYVESALKVFNYKDRMVLLRTTETGGKIYPQRIRISGTGSSGDDFRVTASGAGVIDIPDANWIMGASYNRDDLIIYTQKATWMLKYTGNDIVPFTLIKIDGTRGNKAPFAPVSYLNTTKAYSPEAFTITDGYQVERFDQRITNFGFEEINQANFDLCYSGTVEDDRNHYLIHPSPEIDTSDRILINNYDEGNFAIFRIPLSCMGLYYKSFDITWNDLLVYEGENAWDAFAADYATWNDISYSEDEPISIGGGHNGEIWELNADASEDNQLRIWGMAVDTLGPLVLDITTDWHNYVVGDYVYISGVVGATEVNGKQGFIKEVVDTHNIKVQFETNDPPTITTYTSGGFISRSIPFEFKTKNFNPYGEMGTKVRCGYVYFYADIAGTLIEDIEQNAVPAKLTIEVYADDKNQPTQVTAIVSDPPYNYESNMSNYNGRVSRKQWYKVFVNQTANFLQFKISNTQAGARIKIHAIMPGFMPVGRVI